jgi:uncharacterized protein YjbI with pentapeptide repeats
MNSPQVTPPAIVSSSDESERVPHEKSQVQVIPGTRRRYFGCISGKTIFKILSAVLIPLCIGVFTIVTNLQQTTIANSNRLKDLFIANETRHADQMIADAQRAQDTLLAAENRAKDRDLASDGQRETVLNEYKRDIADLLLANNYSLSIQMKEYVIRPKTLAALRQLDIHRKAQLILFLFESKLLTRQEPVDLSGADLNSIVFPQPIGQKLQLTNISLVRVSLRNASFKNCFIHFADFTLSDMIDVDFSYAVMLAIDFDGANLAYSNFDQTIVFASNFRKANITGTQLWPHSQNAQQQFSVFDAIINMTHKGDQYNYLKEEDDCILSMDWYNSGIIIRRYNEINGDNSHLLLPPARRQGPCYYYSQTPGSYMRKTFKMLPSQDRFVAEFPTSIEVYFDIIHQREINWLTPCENKGKKARLK